MLLVDYFCITVGSDKFESAGNGDALAQRSSGQADVEGWRPGLLLTTVHHQHNNLAGPFWPLKDKWHNLLPLA